MRSWREKRAEMLQDDGLSVLEDMSEFVGVDPYAMRSALEYAGIPWRFEGTGTACSGDGDEEDAPEVWVDPWVVPLVCGLSVMAGAPEPAGNPTNRTVGDTRRCTMQFAAMLRRAREVLTAEHIAALMTVYTLAYAETPSEWKSAGLMDYSAIREFLVHVGAGVGEGEVLPLPSDAEWMEVYARVKATGDWRPDYGDEAF